MQDQAESFRRRVEELNADGAGRRRFTPELRAEAVGYLQLRRKAGARAEAVSEELGVSMTALDKWRRKQSGEGKRAKRFVRVQPRSESHGLIFETPSGHRVQGLAMTDVIQLVERFAT